MAGPQLMTQQCQSILNQRFAAKTTRSFTLAERHKHRRVSYLCIDLTSMRTSPVGTGGEILSLRSLGRNSIFELCSSAFWLIWFINQRALYNHALSIVLLRGWHRLCTPPLATGLNIETSYLVQIFAHWFINRRAKNNHALSNVIGIGSGEICAHLPLPQR